MPVTSRTKRGSTPLRVSALVALLASFLLAAAAFAQESRSGDALRSARASSDRKEFDKAATTLRAALRTDPEDKDMLSLLARVLAWSRHFDESIAMYRKLLALDPDDAFDRAGYARVLAWSGRSDAALPEFRRAIARDSTDLETRIGYARALSWDGDLAGASTEFLRVIGSNPNNGDAWLGLATVARWRAAPGPGFLKRSSYRSRRNPFLSLCRRLACEIVSPSRRRGKRLFSRM